MGLARKDIVELRKIIHSMVPIQTDTAERIEARLVAWRDTYAREKLAKAVPRRIFRMSDEDLQDHELQARIATHNGVIDQIEEALGVIEKAPLMPNFDASSPHADKLRTALRLDQGRD